MKPIIKKGIVAFAILGGSIAAPVIPQDMELIYSYQYNVNDAVSAQSIEVDITSTTKDVLSAFVTPQFEDRDGNGVVSVSVFSNRKGEAIYTQIDESRYQDMGKVGGYTQNPEKNELISAVELFTPKAEAAIAFDATSRVTTGSGVTSVTHAHTTTGSNRFFVATLTTLNWTAGNPTNVTATYGGISMTAVAINRQVFTGANNWRSHGFYLAGPASGANNVVVTTTGGSGIIRMSVASYTGVAQTSPVIASNSASSPDTGNTMTISLTTSQSAWWLIGGSNVDAVWIGGANTTSVRDTTGDSGIADSNGNISAQTGNTQVSHTGSRGYAGVAIAFIEAAGSTPRRIISSE